MLSALVSVTAPEDAGVRTEGGCGWQDATVARATAHASIKAKPRGPVASAGTAARAISVDGRHSEFKSSRGMAIPLPAKLRAATDCPQPASITTVSGGRDGGRSWHGGRRVANAATPEDEHRENLRAVDHEGEVGPGSTRHCGDRRKCGDPQLASFRPTGAIEDTLWTVDRFYHLTPDKGDLGCLWRATEAWQSAVGKKIVPIAHDGGGNQVVLDYRSGEPTIQVCIHDEDFRMLYISDSFSGFLELLVEDPDGI